MAEVEDIDVTDTGDGDSNEPTGDSAWYDNQGFSDEQIGLAQNKGWETASDMLKSYSELEKFRGADENSLLKLPKDDDENGWKEVRKKLGMPDTADEYVINTPEGMEFSEDDQNWFKEAMHKRGMSSADATEFFSDLSGREVSLRQAQEAAANEAKEADVASLKSEWGPKFDERVELANRVLRGNGISPEQVEGLRDSLGFKQTIELMANLGEKMGGDTILQGDAETPAFGKTMQQYKADLAQLNAEIGADKNRFELVAQGKGPDVLRRKNLREIINNLSQ